MDSNSQKIKAFTWKTVGLSNRLITKVTISANSKSLEVYALWDTGATNTCISQQVYDTLGLSPVSFTTMQTASSKEVASVTLINVKLPNDVSVKDVRAIVSKIGEQVFPIKEEDGQTYIRRLDVLIGMDIICLGDFSVSNFQGNTTLTFRIPSISEIDFTKGIPSSVPLKGIKQPGRNDPCPCGSKKKYKNCCGKK